MREAGLACSVFLMPILPYLTDSRAHLDTALRQAKEAGASSVMYTALHLRPFVKEWFMLWLERERPELVGRYVQLYGGNAYAPTGYRKWLAARIKQGGAAAIVQSPRIEPGETRSFTRELTEFGSEARELAVECHAP